MCMSCNKAKAQQTSSTGGKAKASTSNGNRRLMGVTMSSGYGKPKVRFSGRGR